MKGTFKNLFESENSCNNLSINMEDVSSDFNSVTITKVHIKCRSTVLILTTGFPKLDMTFVLACCTDGSKLKPVIFVLKKSYD